MAYNLTREQWYGFWRRLRQADRARDWISKGDDLLAGKAKYIAYIDEHAVDGKVCVNSRFMDCDCAVGTDWTIVPAIFVAVEKVIDDIYQNAEGPGSVWLSKPEDKVAPEFRDLALEAFEDGHPHSIHY